MILVDAGPLIAILDRGEADHLRCVQALSRLTAPLLTTWPVLTEAFFLLGDAGGWPAQKALWTLLDRDLQIIDLDQALLTRIRGLMSKYNDLPMDLADASLVTVAESLNLRRVFTLDSDFSIYRFRGRGMFEVIP